MTEQPKPKGLEELDRYLRYRANGPWPMDIEKLEEAWNNDPSQVKTVFGVKVNDDGIIEDTQHPDILELWREARKGKTESQITKPTPGAIFDAPADKN